MSTEGTHWPRIPARDAGSHKGTFGAVAIVGGCCAGSSRMIGAPALTALGALRAGAGLARVYAPRPILSHVLSAAPSATGIALPVDSEGALHASDAAAVLDVAIDTCQALMIGPGMGDAPSVQALALRAVQQESIPVVVDADGLNALAQITDLFRDFRARAVLTPHPGEFRRLAASLRITHDPVNPATRPAAAEELARRLGCIVVLKGAGTVVSNGLESWVCERGHPCMATAGSGDVLTGVIGALAAAHSRTGDKPLSLFDVARLGVEAHARAGEHWAAKSRVSAGMLASELADQIPAALEELR